MAGELANKIAIVTGGSSGIGRGIVDLFIREGAQVIVADVNEEQGQKLVAEWGPNAVFKKTDVSKQSEIKALIDFADTTFGKLDIMVNNAGIGGARHPSLLDEDFADFEKVLGINLLGVMAGTREAARYMGPRGGGAVVNISSIGGMQSGPGNWAYGVAKSSVIHFSKAAAIDLGEFNVRVNVVSPGNIETPILAENMAGHMPEAEREVYVANIRKYLITRQPIQRQGTVEDLAQAVMFYCSDRSTYVTGTVMAVDGGLVAGGPPRSSGASVASANKG